MGFSGTVSRRRFLGSFGAAGAASMAAAVFPGGLGAGTAVAATGAPVNELEKVMWCSQAGAPHETPPAVPSGWSWYDSTENNVPPADTVSNFTMWGQIYQTAGSSVPDGTWINLRWLEGWTFDGAVWTQQQQLDTGIGDADGSHYTNSTFDNSGAPAPTFRTEPDGTTSVLMVDGWNFHFWPGPRAPLPARWQAAYSTFQARLSPDSPVSAQGSLVANSGVDYWTDPDTGNNPGGTIGRFCHLTTYWKALSACSDQNALGNTAPLFR